MHENRMQPRGLTAIITGDPGGSRFEGAAVLRERPHPLTQVPALQLGVPDDVLDFRPSPGLTYRISIDDAGEQRRFTSRSVWLERVQTSWWFILEPDGSDVA